MLAAEQEGDGRREREEVEEVEQRLQRIDTRVEEESEMLKRILMSLMSEQENARVFGDRD